MFEQKVLSLWQQHVPSCQNKLEEIIVISSARFFTISLTETGANSRDHSIPSLETKNFMFLYCGLKVLKMGMEIKFWLTVSTSGDSTPICYEWNDFCLIWYRFGCSWLWLVEKLFKKGIVFRFRSHDSPFWESNIYHHRRTLELSVFGPWKECSKHNSTLRFKNSRNKFQRPLSMFGNRHTFVVNNTFEDKRRFQ